MSYRSLLFPLLVALSLSACTPTSYGVSYPSSPAYPEPGSPGRSLADLLTGAVVTDEEEQLRDTLQRQIVLNFPIKVGVLFYQLNSKLDRSDRDAAFKQVQASLQNSGLISESIQIPDALVSGASNLDELRRLGSRFQTHVLILISGSHEFDKSRSQNLSFFDSFSDKAYFESNVQFEAIALDVFTGTLLTPFSASLKGETRLLDQADVNFKQNSYTYQKEVENQAWKILEQEALARLTQLKANVEARINTISPTPAPSAETPSTETEGAE